MHTAILTHRVKTRQSGFSLTELMVASAIALGISGSMIFLLLQGAAEQRRGLASATVEQSANFLQSSIVNCLRGMSANQGLSPNYTSALLDANGHLLGYQTVFVFYANADGSYTTQQISVDARSGRVTYTPDVSKPASTVLWMTNGVNVALRQLCFSTSFNPDGSLNSSLVNVQFNMDDNGATQQGSNNNSTSLFRTFSVRMRSDS